MVRGGSWVFRCGRVSGAGARPQECKDPALGAKPAHTNIEKRPDLINANTVAKTVVKEDNQEEVERLAVIISAISEEMREPVENFSIVSITEI